MAYKKKDSEHLKTLKLPRKLHSKLKLVIALEEMNRNEKIYMSEMMIDCLEDYAEEMLQKHRISFEVGASE